MTYEELEIAIGRQPSDMEVFASSNGYPPRFKVGDKVECLVNEPPNEIDAVILFKLPGAGENYAWAARMKGWVDFQHQDNFTLAVDKLD